MPRLIYNPSDVSSMVSWDVCNGPSDAMRELTGIVGLTPVPTVKDDWWIDVLSGLWRRLAASPSKDKDTPKRVIDLEWDYGRQFLELDGPLASVMTRRQIMSRSRNRDGFVRGAGELVWGALASEGHGRVVVVGITTTERTKVFLFASHPEEVPWFMKVAEAYGIPRDPLTGRTRRSLAIIEKRYPAPEAFVPAPVPMVATIIGRPRYR